MNSADMASYMRARRRSRRQRLLDMHGAKCMRCGATENLEFHHRDRSEKRFVLSGCHLDKAWITILAEAEKCDLVCKECHLGCTRQQYADGWIVPVNSLRHLPYVHGTPRTYEELACRCEACREAKRLYRNKTISYHETVPSRVA